MIPAAPANWLLLVLALVSLVSCAPGDTYVLMDAYMDGEMRRIEDALTP